VGGVKKVLSSLAVDIKNRRRERPQRKIFLWTKNKFFTMGTLAMMLAFGLVLAGCENDADDGDKDTTVTSAEQILGNWYYG
jgi:hypothetical protein